MDYRIELWQLGELTGSWETDDLASARRIYRRYIRDDDCAVEVFQNGERLKAPKAWELMEGWDGYGYFLFSNCQ